MNKKRITVIIPAYNSETSLNVTIDSVLNQTVTVDEIIVINDGSDDKTGNIAKSYKDRIFYFEKDNGGAASARNVGLKHASGDYIMLLDADDYILPRSIEQTRNFLDKHPECIAVSTGQIIKKKEGVEDDILPHFYKDNSEMEELVIDNFFKFWGEHDHLLTGSVLIRSEACKAVGHQLENLRISEDLEYWGMLGTLGKWGFIPEVLWVGTSALVSEKTGWVEHFRKRRQLCPMVEDWEVRLKDRIQEKEIEGYQMVLGRVALGYAHNHLLSKRFNIVKSIVADYGDLFPKTRMAKLIKLGSKFKMIGVKLAYYVVCFSEYLKDRKKII